MLNQVAVEALYSATYVENYLDSMENLPDDVQRQLSRIRELDVQYRNHLRDAEFYADQARLNQPNESEPTAASKRAMARVQQSLIAAQELGDEKLQVIQQLHDIIDHKTRQLDQDFKNLDYGRDEKMIEVPQKEVRQPSPPATSPTNVAAPHQNIPPAAPVNAQTVNSLVSSSANNTSNNTNTSSNSYTNNSANNTNNNSGGGGVTNERTSKRASRRRTETSGNGANTPVSAAVVSTPMEIEPVDIKVEAPQTTKQATSQSNNSNTGKKASGSGKKKKRKTGRQGNHAAREVREDTPPQEEAIDPDEPTYCLCDQISFGEMILCDNDLCPIEWFHFSCVALMSKPKGKWFCPNCRGERPNVMKPKAQFLKELERYNKEKEEKT